MRRHFQLLFIVLIQFTTLLLAKPSTRPLSNFTLPESSIPNTNTRCVADCFYPRKDSTLLSLSIFISLNDQFGRHPISKYTKKRRVSPSRPCLASQDQSPTISTASSCRNKRNPKRDRNSWRRWPNAVETLSLETGTGYQHRIPYHVC